MYRQPQMAKSFCHSEAMQISRRFEIRVEEAGRMASSDFGEGEIPWDLKKHG